MNDNTFETINREIDKGSKYFYFNKDLEFVVANKDKRSFIGECFVVYIDSHISRKKIESRVRFGGGVA